jgi:hypothetical protein
MSHNKYLIHFIPNKKLNSYELENLLSTINSIYNICHIVNFTIEKQRAGETGDYFIYFHLPFTYLRPFYEIEKYLTKSSSENKNYSYVDTNLIEFFLTDIFNKLDKIIPENKKLLIKTVEIDSSNDITLVPQDEESANDMDKLIQISKKIGSIDTVDNIHYDDSNEIIREKIINRFEDRSYFSYFEKVYVAFGNTPIYNIIIRGLLKSLVNLNYFHQSEKVFYKGLER